MKRYQQISTVSAPMLGAIGSLILLSPSVTSATPQGAAGLSYHKVALTGEPVPGTEPGVIFSVFTTGLSHSIMSPRIDDEGRPAFIALVTGPGVNETNQSGIWSDVDGALQLVVRTGMQAPGVPEGVVFTGVPSDYLPFPPSFQAGRAAFQGTLAGPGADTTSNDGVWIGQPGFIALVAREGDPASGMGAGANFSTVFGTVGNDGHVGLRGTASGPGVTTANNEGVWSDRSGSLQLIVREGDPAPGTDPGVMFANGGIGASPNPFPAAVFNGTSQLLLRGDLEGPGVDSYNDEALFIEQDGELTLYVREGDPAPVPLSGVTFGGNSVSWSLNYPSFNDAGHTAFNCRLGGSIPTTTAMFSDRNGALELVAFPGDPAPGTDFEFTLTGQPVLNDSGELAFTAAAPDHDNDPFTPPPFGVFWTQPGALSPLVLPGDQVVDDSIPHTFIGASGVLGYNASGELAFSGRLDDFPTGSEAALLLANSMGKIHVVVTTGEHFDVFGDGSDLREVVRIVPGGLSETGAVVFRLDFTDGSSGHFTAVLPPAFAPGDLNCDGQLDMNDVPLFVEAVIDPAAYTGCDLNLADVNGDTMINGQDIRPLAEALLGL